jgi:rRNA-processing protein FCF1
MSNVDDNLTETFIAKLIYPNAESIFVPVQTLEEIKESCYIVIDTNVLLAPYAVGKYDLLEQLKTTYRSLVSQKRLIIPGQVAREFAKNRAAKIQELYQQLARKQVPSMQKGTYPLLSSLEQYEEVMQLERVIDETLNSYAQKYKKALNKLLTQIYEWRWNDPVTLLYSQIFEKDAIVNPSIKDDELLNDFKRRQRYNIPPGYKDRGKDNNNIGDLVIWHTILELGSTKKESIIFVSGDEKSDWYLKSEGKPLYPRYELVDEFRRHSEGKSFHIMKLPDFLELFGASNELVEELREEEKNLESKAQTFIDTTEDVEDFYYDKIVRWIGFKYDYASLTVTENRIVDIASEDNKRVMIKWYIFQETKSVIENIQKMIEMDKNSIDNYTDEKPPQANISGTLIAFITRSDASYISFLTKNLVAENRLRMPHQHTLIIGYFYGLDFNKVLEYSYNSQITEDTF